MARPRRQGGKRFITPLLVVLALLVGGMFAVAWIPVRQAHDAFVAGRDAEAISTAQQWSQLFVWRKQYSQILAAAYLASGNSAAAAPYLRTIDSPLISAIDKPDVARRLFARERYAEFLAYDAASHDRSESAGVPLYRAAAAAATNRVAEAEAALRSVNPGSVDRAKYDWLRNAIAQRQSGNVPFVFDRNGKAIASFDAKTNRIVVDNADFASLIDSRAGSLTIGAQLGTLGSYDTIETTLDPVAQRAAVAALGNYRGSLVAIDPRTNEVLAIVSTRGKGALADLALESQYEPGSVIKVLTGLNALSNGVNVDSMFPYVCKGELMIDGRHFGDWVPQGHGKLNTFNDALAVSCNVFFADVGLRLGRDRLQKFMTAAGFGGFANLGIVRAPLGRFVGDVFNNFETGFLAIGLVHESINTLHLSMLAEMVANRGVISVPRLLRQRRSIVGDIVPVAASPPPNRIASPAAAQRVIAAMQAVASSPRGTGRRAPVEGITMAMKTGTAGERKSGLEALIMAFAPIDSPKIAFGIIAEDAGPAEYAGAKIAHDFLERMKPALK